jgi:hypothetical protein
MRSRLMGSMMLLTVYLTIISTSYYSSDCVSLSFSDRYNASAIKEVCRISEHMRGI